MKFSIVGTRVWMDGAALPHHDTKNTSGKHRDLKFGVLHYTASPWFKSDLHTLTQRLSVHFLLGPEPGQFVQIGELDDTLWHAGKSKWKGLSGLNKYSIGVEVTCPGWLDLRTDKGWTRDDLRDNGMYWPEDQVIVARHRNGGRNKAWVPFNPRQMEILSEFCPFMRRTLDIEWVGHDDISPNRKQDPGPCLARKFIAEWNGAEIEAASRLLRKGDKGAVVKDLQAHLASLGYEVGPIDGDFGPKTQKAVVKFQTDNKLRVQQ